MLKSDTTCCKVIQSGTYCLHCVTRYYSVLYSDKKCYILIQIVLQNVTKCYKVFQSVAEWYEVLHIASNCVTNYYKELQKAIKW